MKGAWIYYPIKRENPKHTLKIFKRNRNKIAETPQKQETLQSEIPRNFQTKYK